MDSWLNVLGLDPAALAFSVVFALASVPADALRIALAAVVLVAAVLIWRGFALEEAPGRTATVAVGLLAGFLNGSMAIVGPPVILFYFATPLGVAVGRASMVTYLLGTDSIGAGMFALQGLVGSEILWRTACFLPVLLLGVAAGHRWFLGTSPEAFKKFALLLLMGLSIALLVRSL
ncbi:MAG: TSUP family transporter [Geminicoccaceae bacterium]